MNMWYMYLYICKMASCVFFSTYMYFVTHLYSEIILLFTPYRIFLQRSKAELWYTVFPKILEVTLHVFLEERHVPEIE